MPRSLRLAAFFLLAASVRAGCQTSLADSVAKLNRAKRWQEAASVANSSLENSQAAERCALRLGLVQAETGYGGYEDAAEDLKTFDEQCTGSDVARREARSLAATRSLLALPPLPKTGLDFSAVDAFWRVADVLQRDAEPTERQWHAMMSSVGYRLSMQVVPTTRHDMEVALRPSQRGARDSIESKDTDEANRVRHLALVVTRRAELARYRDSLTHAVPVQQAVALAARFLPPRGTDGMAPPLVAFALFRDDAYSLGPQGVVIDLDHIQEEGGLTLLLGHEFHHTYLSTLSRLRPVPGDDPAANLLQALRTMRNEGIADLIDKPHPLTGTTPFMIAYAKRYNDAYDRTPQVVRSIDSALVVAARDITQIRAVGQRVQQLLPSAGHYNGSYVAREIYETFGVDSLYPGVADPIAFLHTFASAEAKRGNPPPFSPTALALLDSLDRAFAKP